MGIAMRMISLAQNGRDLNDYSSSSLPLPQMGASSAPKSSAASTMSREDYNRCATMYNQLDPGKKGALTNEQVTTMLQKTGLPAEVLKQAWGMVERNAGGMVERSFVIALLFLLIKCRDGQQLPGSVPAELKNAVKGFEGKSVSQEKKLDPFAELASSLISGSSNPPPSYPKATGGSYHGSLDSQIRPPESMKNILPKTAAVNRGPKIDPGMQSVLEEQDTDLIKGSQLQALDDDGDSKGTSYYISQLNSLNSERIKLKNSIGRQRADIKKEEDYMIHYQSQINKVIDEYSAAVKELEDILVKKAASESRPQANNVPFQRPAPPPPVNAFPTNAAPPNTYPNPRPAAQPTNAFQPPPRPAPAPFQPPAQSPRPPASASAAPQFAPRPAAPANAFSQPSPRPVPRPAAPSFQGAQTRPQQTAQANASPGFQDFDNGGDSAFGWGNDDFGNAGVVKGNDNKPEVEFDFS
eukprot:TRINITY_DN6593_c0_g1_i11.p1 TRINITY_DN6593_c0_g1~~TRINITY_DN6593_c0_g1_i11.p1  ORF type:complete len:467 (-),score=102.62 TRINITY_DN6593_c0_g1_i11:104-1504(-)